MGLYIPFGRWAISLTQLEPYSVCLRNRPGPGYRSTAAIIYLSYQGQINRSRGPEFGDSSRRYSVLRLPAVPYPFPQKKGYPIARTFPIIS